MIDRIAPRARRSGCAAVALVALTAAAACTSSTATASERVATSTTATASRTATPAAPATGATVASTTTTTVAPPAPVRVAYYGDSTALVLGLGTGPWMQGSGGAVLPARGSTALGCGLLGAGRVRDRGVELDKHPSCDLWLDEWRAALAIEVPDLAIVSAGPIDVLDRRLDGVEGFVAPGDPQLDQRLQAAMLDAVDLLAGSGATVIWLTAPYIEKGSVDGVAPAASFAESDDERMDRYNDLVRALPSLRPGDVAVVDLAAWLHDGGPALDAQRRPDGVHLAVDAAKVVTVDWLGPAVLRAHRQLVDVRAS